MPGQKNQSTNTKEATALKADITLLKTERDKLYKEVDPARKKATLKKEVKKLEEAVVKLENLKQAMIASKAREYDKLTANYEDSVRDFLTTQSAEADKASLKRLACEKEALEAKEKLACKRKEYSKFSATYEVMKSELADLERDLTTREHIIRCADKERAKTRKTLARDAKKLSSDRKDFEATRGKESKRLLNRSETIAEKEDDLLYSENTLTKRFFKVEESLDRRKKELEIFSAALKQEAENLNFIELKLIQRSNKVSKDEELIAKDYADLKTNWKTYAEARQKFNWEVKRKRNH
ncbi:MAG: hypothetical protein KAT00_13785 [Planctomycetes bacterium]|nr:hypothetical protein [Planctomycetota bacterium]